MSSSSAPRSLSALLLAALLLPALPACSGEDEAEAAPPPETARPPRDPRLVEAQVAFERGEPDVARTLLDQAVDVDAVDRLVLEARLSLAEGDPLGALRDLGKAKSAWPDDGRVYAAEAELFAAMGRTSGAEDAIATGLERAGSCAELERARAVLALSIPGGAELGLAHLERARALDPNVPYARHASAQAHLLVGRMDLSRDAPESALEHALAALAWDSSDLAYGELEAEALAALLRFDTALAKYAELEAAGAIVRTRRARLHQQAATARLIAGDRERALEHYLAASALGLPREELGFGASLLSDAAAEAVDRGVERYEAGALAEAQAAFERALELDPEDWAARSHLGVVRFRQEDYEGAERAWSIVVRDALASGAELPEPVHLNLARARMLLDDVDGARDVCSRYLDARPEGAWAEETRDLLLKLEGVALEGGR